ncbi:unnamed protein product [Microthlaspi erraticum]|uniref:Uncharacterized protein n=1 Tax=Microthlaspi erraticum TaxID=1685480 RepID=A0A6D2IXU4_9BRAS|nr:unnamed protein product [Microthlaspi erraticum]
MRSKTNVSDVGTRISKLSRDRGLCLRRQRQVQFQLFSNSATPYLLLRNHNNNKDSIKRLVMSIDLFDPRKQETVKISEQRVSKEVHESVSIASTKRMGVPEEHARFQFTTNQCLQPCLVRCIPASCGCRQSSSFAYLSLSLPRRGRRRLCGAMVAVTFSACSMLGLCRPGDSE